MIPTGVRPDNALLMRLASLQERHDKAVKGFARCEDADHLAHVRLNTRIELPRALVDDRAVEHVVVEEIRRRLPEILIAAETRMRDDVERARDDLNLDISIRADVLAEELAETRAAAEAKP